MVNGTYNGSSRLFRFRTGTLIAYIFNVSVKPIGACSFCPTGAKHLGLFWPWKHLFPHKNSTCGLKGITACFTFPANMHQKLRQERPAGYQALTGMNTIEFFSSSDVIWHATLLKTFPKGCYHVYFVGSGSLACSP